MQKTNKQTNKILCETRALLIHHVQKLVKTKIQDLLSLNTLIKHRTYCGLRLQRCIYIYSVTQLKCQKKF